MEITANVPTVDDTAAGSIGHNCENCGSPVDDDDSFCPACGTPQPKAVKTPSGQPQRIARYFACQNCGAKVSTDPSQRSYVCAFCDSTYVVEYSPELTGRQPPEFVIGFRVSPEEAVQKFRHWIKENNWFRPGDLKLARLAEKMRGVYLPFWAFTMLAQSRWSAQIGEYWYRTETYTTRVNGRTVTRTRTVRETEWRPLSGRHHRYYNGYMISGSRGLPQEQAQWIMPFHLPALRRYRPEYLAGWLSEEYSIEREEALRLCRQVFEQQEQANIAAFLPGDTHRGLQAETHFSHVTSDLCLLPIYLVSYRYQNKLYRFLVNGQTGKVSGEKPVSWVRIGITVAIIAVLILIFALVMSGR